MNKYETTFDPKQTLAKLTLDPVQTISAKVTMEFTETEDAFIFDTINPFLKHHSHMEISKQELIEAIQIIRLRKEAREKHGTYFSEYCDLTSAKATVFELDNAYKRGVQDGKDSMYETMMNKFREMED